MENGFDVVNLHGSVSGVVPVPVIGQNGNWYVGNQDTGIKAQGEKGDIGESGSQGEQGLKGDTPELAANLTTVEAGMALDATMGKVLDDKITEADSKVPFALGIDEDGNYGYIKAGADSVTPFSFSSGSPFIFTSSPVNIKSLLPDVWDKLTEADFMVGGMTVEASSYCLEKSATIGTIPVVTAKCSYDKTEGILTFATSLHADFMNYWGGADYGNLDMTGIFAVYKGTVGGK